MPVYGEDLQEYSLKDFRQNLTQIVGEVIHTHKRIKVTSYGRVAGYFIPAEDMIYLEAMEELEDLKAAEAYKAKGENQQLFSLDTLKQELGL
jgi:prevent-host-death family protein